MANLIDFIVDLFRDDSKAQSFVNNPTQALSNAGLPDVTPEYTPVEPPTVTGANVNVRSAGRNDAPAVFRQAYEYKKK